MSLAGKKENRIMAKQWKLDMKKEKEDKNLSGNLRFYVSSENEKVEIGHDRQGKTLQS